MIFAEKEKDDLKTCAHCQFVSCPILIGMIIYGWLIILYQMVKKVAAENHYKMQCCLCAHLSKVSFVAVYNQCSPHCLMGIWVCPILRLFWSNLIIATCRPCIAGCKKMRALRSINNRSILLVIIVTYELDQVYCAWLY